MHDISTFSLLKRLQVKPLFTQWRNNLIEQLNICAANSESGLLESQKSESE